MFRGFIFFILILTITSKAFSNCLKENIVKDQYIIKVKNNVESLQKLSLKNNSFKIKSYIHKKKSHSTRFYSKLDHENTFDTLVIETKNLDSITKDSNILSIEQDCYAQIFSLNTSDPLHVLQNWYFNSLNANKNLSLITKKEVTVAVVDTGVDVFHEDLSDNIWKNQTELNGLEGVDDDQNGFIDDFYGFDVADNDNDPVPTLRDFALDFDHGTHVAGLVAATFNNDTGIFGITRNQVKVMAVKGFRSKEKTPISDLLKGIYYAVDNGADVINASWGSTKNASEAEADAINYALNREVLVVAAAGNSTVQASRVTPASIPGVVTVSSINSDNQLSTFSNYGTSVNFISPGGDGSERLNERLFSTIIENDYDSIRGTSMSAPLVSGLIALLMSQRADLSPFMALRALNSTAIELKLRSFNGNSEQLYRKPDLDEALNYIIENETINKLNPLLLTVFDPSENLETIGLSSNAASNSASGCALTKNSAKASGTTKGHSLIVTLLFVLPSLVSLAARRKKYY